jgi:hypothetical protein
VASQWPDRGPSSAAFIPELLDRLVVWGALTVTPDVEKLLRQISRPTLARVLEPARTQFPVRGATITRPSHLLRQEIPVRTFTDWDDARPGFLEIDLVAHCGPQHPGLLSLYAVRGGHHDRVDRAGRGLGQEPGAGRSAVHRVRERLPVPLVGLDSDKGS